MDLTLSGQKVGGCIIGADGKSVCTLIDVSSDGTNVVPRTDGGAVGSNVSTGSVSNTTAQGVGTSTNFSLASFETLILSDIAKLFSNQLVVLAVLIVAGYFAWKHFHKRR